MYFYLSTLSITLITSAVVALAVVPVAIPSVDLINNCVCSEASVDSFDAISFPANPPAYPNPPPINPETVPSRTALPIFSPVSFSPVKAQLVACETPPATAPPTVDAPTYTATFPTVFVRVAARAPPPAAIGAANAPPAAPTAV